MLEPDAPDSGRREAEAVLHRYWGHSSLRPGQWEVIQAVLAGRDALAVLPTGGGKSVCYQMPALLKRGLVMVISPLISLMQDQVASLQGRGIPAACINSTLSAREVDQRWTDAEFGRYRLLYVAPERLQTDLFLARAERLPVVLLAIDEAHCVSEWGHDFRPAYLGIPEARSLLGDPPAVAVTATATPQVRKDIVEHLSLRDPHIVVKGFDRPNIIWSIFREENKRAKVLDIIRGVSGSGILYAATRRGVEHWAEWLAGQGESVQTYHGGMAASLRESAQGEWLRGEKRLMVATNAFGMGIDRPDVRFVIHVDVPATLEAYYQEAGRAGRDGQKAHAVLLFHPEDATVQLTLIADGHPAVKDLQMVYDAVCSLGQIAIGSHPDAPVTLDLDALVRLTGFSAGRVKSAIALLARQGIWQALPARKHHGLLRFLQPPGAVRAYTEGLQNQALARFLSELLRTVHADAYSDWWEMDMRLLEKRLKLSRERIERGFAFLQQRGLVSWQAPGGALQVVFGGPRSRKIVVDDLMMQRARRRSESRLEDMLRYARSVTCRRHFLLAYFGEESRSRCGRCDVCLGRHRPVEITPDDEPLMRHILHKVKEGAPPSDWFETAPPPAYHLEGLVDWLIQEGYLRLESPLEEKLTVTPRAHSFLEQWLPRRSTST